MTWSALHDACEHQDSAAVIKRARSVSEEAVLVDDHGSTPLHIAAWTNPPIAVLKALIEAHPHAVLEKDWHGDTPMHISLNHDANVEVVREMLEAAPNVASIPNKEGLMPIHTALRYCPENEEIIGLLVEAYPFALRTHIKMGDPAPGKGVQPLLTKSLSNHVVVDASPRTGVSAADLRFEERGTQIRDGSYPLHIAVSNGATLPVLEMLLKEAPDVLRMGDKHGRTPVHIALATGAGLETIDLFLSVDVGPAKMAEKHSLNLPIHIACMYGCSVDVAKMLLKANPSAIHAKNAAGKCPLEVAESSGKCNDEILHLLQLSEEAE